MIVIIVLSMLATTGNGLASPTSTIGVRTSSVGVANLPAGSFSPTAVGVASSFGLTGPTLVTPGFVPAGTTLSANDFPKISPQLAKYPNLNPKASGHVGQALASLASATSSTSATTGLPVVSCQPIGPGCDTVTTNPGGAMTNPYGLAATSNGALYGQDVEPPDQGLCAGNGYVMESINLGEVQVFNASLGSPSSIVSLDSLMGLTTLGYSSGGDIQCLYDAGNGGHWFITEFVSTTPESAGGVFAGCFAAVFDTCREGIAVSSTNNPMGTYHVYFFNPNAVNLDPGYGYLLNDYAKTATTQDAFLLFYDEFNLNGATIPACPAYGCLGFNGAQEFAFAKTALELGAPVSSPTFNIAYVNLGLVPTPDGSCDTANFTCWYQVIPAQSPDPSQFDNSYGGTGFMVASLDFFGVGDTRIAVFYWTGLSALNSAGCSLCSQVGFGGQLFTGLEMYLDEGGACLASNGGFCGLGAQEPGRIPLGWNCVSMGLATGVKHCSEGGIASNGDGATQAYFSAGQIWMAVSTLVVQQYGSGTCSTGATCEVHLGAAYFVIGTKSFDTRGVLSLTSQGYVTAMHADLEFPSIAAGDTGAQGAIISFTLNGPNYYPSSAFGRLYATSSGLVGNRIRITAAGMSPQDGFTEYLGFPHGLRPRWGDYGAVAYVPGTGFYFASEYIQYPNCPSFQFMKDPTCGGTRDPYANFGTSINWLP